MRSRVCVCVCVCVKERVSETDTDRMGNHVCEAKVHFPHVVVCSHCGIFSEEEKKKMKMRKNPSDNKHLGLLETCL